MAAEVQVHDGTRAAKAQARAERIRSHLADAAQDYAAAILEEDWKVLGYGSIEAWRETMFAGTRLAVETRRQVAELLSAEGKTVREIAEATETTKSTAARDLSQSGTRAPDQASSHENVTREKPGKKQPKTAAERQRDRRERKKEPPEPVEQPVTTTTETKTTETKTTETGELTADELFPPPGDAQSWTTLLGENARLELRVEELTAGLAEKDAENARLRERVAEQAERLETTHVTALEKRCAELEKENSKLKTARSSPLDQLKARCAHPEDRRGYDEQNVLRCGICRQELDEEEVPA
jgi:hypothetical protein